MKGIFAWLLVGLLLAGGFVSSSPPSAAVTDPYGNPITRFESTSNFPLYAALKSENIYLYGVKPYGMVLYQDGTGTYFDWPGLTPRGILPELSYLDYDGDGGRELAVALYVGSGTQLSVMDLHILEIEKPAKDGRHKPGYADHSLLGDDVEEWMTKEFAGALSADGKTIILSFDGETYQADNRTDHPEAGEFQSVVFGDIVEFRLDGGKISVEIAVGAVYENVAQPRLFGSIRGEVRFDGSGFTLENCALDMT